jgi:hypothetical protein
LSSLFTQFEPTQCVESLEAGRTYPKRAVVSYLTGRPICECFRDGDGRSLTECSELKIMIDHFGLLPLGPPRNVRFLGEHVIEAEIRRNTNSRTDSLYNRVSAEKVGEGENK